MFYISFKWKIIAYCDRHFIPKTVGAPKEQEERLHRGVLVSPKSLPQGSYPWALGIVNVPEGGSKAVEFDQNVPMIHRTVCR